MLAAFESEAELHLVMELLDGGTLLDLLKARVNGALQEEEARRLIFHIGAGVRQLHMIGVVHRDLKPDNILLDAHGVPKICDFGFAKRCHESPSKWARFASSPCGTPGFVAPEVCGAHPMIRLG